MIFRDMPRMVPRYDQRKITSGGARRRLFALALAGTVGASQFSVRAAQCEETTAEVTLRRLATKRVIPEYPASAIKSGLTGLVVADVCVPPGGGAALVEIVESPSPAIGQAVEDALKQWRFDTVYEQGDPSHTHGYGSRVVFYFVNQDGNWRVLSPADTFYVGPRFAHDRR